MTIWGISTISPLETWAWMEVCSANFWIQRQDWKADMESRYGDRSLFLITFQRLKKLPIVPDHWTSTAVSKLNMVVDSISHGFKIFLINDDLDTDNPDTSLEDCSLILNVPLMRVYDSATDEWKGSANSSCIENGVGNVSSVIFGALDYVYLDTSRGDGGLPLWRYNHLKDAWENLAVDIPAKLMFYPELIMAANRLLLVAWSAKRFPLYPGGDIKSATENAWCFEASKMKIPDMTRETLFEFSELDLMSHLGIKEVNLYLLLYSFLHPVVSVFAFGNSLMLMSPKTGNPIAYDLVTSSWDYGLPQNPFGHFADLSFFFGKQMNPHLPGTLW